MINSSAKSQGVYYIFLVDLEGFTKLSSTLSHEELSKFVEEFKNLVQSSVSSNGGRIVKFLGDGAIAVFSVLEQATRAADFLISHYSNTKTKVKIFIAVGEVVLEDNDIFGLDVNFAFRMIETIKGGTLAISEATYNILKDKQGFLPSRELSVKGVGDGIRIFVRGDPQKLITETKDVKFFVRPAGLWDRFISFYLDVLIFISSFGLVSTLTFKRFMEFSKRESALKQVVEQSSQVTERVEGMPEHEIIKEETVLHQQEVREESKVKEETKKETQKSRQDEIKLFEIETPIGKIKAGRGELDIKTQKGEIHTEPGKLEIKLGEKKKFAFSYLHLSGIEVIFFTLYLALCWFFFRGRTFGEWIMKIRVETSDGSSPDLRTSFLRAVLLVFMVLPAGLGVIIPLLITRGRTLLHDTLTKTSVVRSS